jgi:MFS family permease
MTTYSLAFWMPSFLERSHQLSAISVSRILGGVVLIAGSAGVLIGGRLADWLGQRSNRYYVLLPAIFYALAAPVFVGAILATSLWVSITLYAVPTALTYATFGPAIAAIQHNSPPASRAGTAALFYFILNFIGIGAGTLVVGSLSDALHTHFGAESLRYAILLDLVFLLVGAALFASATLFLNRDWNDESS